MNFQFSIFNRKDCGFTLLEIMVVVSIILILTAISIPIYQGSKKQLALQRATNKLAQDIRRAEEMAMAVKEFKGLFPLGGYGIYFVFSEPNHYILFADTNANYQYDEGGELVEDISFENNIEISHLFPSSPLTIVFTPPDPTTRVNSLATTGTIILKIEESTTSVNVLPTGLIYVD